MITFSLSSYIISAMLSPFFTDLREIGFLTIYASASDRVMSTTALDCFLKKNRQGKLFEARPLLNVQRSEEIELVNVLGIVDFQPASPLPLGFLLQNAWGLHSEAENVFQ